MNRSRNQFGERRFHQFTPRARDAKLARDKRLRGRRSKTDDDLRTNPGYLCLQPRPTGGNFLGVRLFVNPEFPALSRIEVFDDVGDIDPLALYPGLGQRFVQ
jgi:hypothetical protein